MVLRMLCGKFLLTVSKVTLITYIFIKKKFEKVIRKGGILDLLFQIKLNLYVFVKSRFHVISNFGVLHGHIVVNGLTLAPHFYT